MSKIGTIQWEQGDNSKSPVGTYESIQNQGINVNLQKHLSEAQQHFNYQQNINPDLWTKPATDDNGNQGYSGKDFYNFAANHGLSEGRHFDNLGINPGTTLNENSQEYKDGKQNIQDRIDKGLLPKDTKADDYFKGEINAATLSVNTWSGNKNIDKSQNPIHVVSNLRKLEAAQRRERQQQNESAGNQINEALKKKVQKTVPYYCRNHRAVMKYQKQTL